MSRSANLPKYCAQNLHNIVEETLLSGSLIKKPLWLDVMKKYPPMQAPMRLVQRDPTRFQPQSGAEYNFKINEQYCRGLKTRKWYFTQKYGTRSEWRKAVNDASKIYAFPAEIKLAEDQERVKQLLSQPLKRFQTISLRQ
ncbi:hypothetical protein MIR68_005264 [Amoeboaphelidium protococcarum]|nr:hypothetical protein MIR68_005264 [Amoeboaphelidium protococcarum]